MFGYNVLPLCGMGPTAYWVSSVLGHSFKRSFFCFFFFKTKKQEVGNGVCWIEVGLRVLYPFEMLNSLYLKCLECVCVFSF